ncbi:MAG: RIP metalloprotease RseP [Oligoflexia bacterium]|nr:RIP metalloprotease RseP [Oligoflexia bacterium]
MLEKIVIFIIFLCPLIFFHELGHFIFARIFGVRVEIFSIGFGPKLFRFVRNGTEYALSLIPLGGYIKMFGDDPLNEKPISEEEKRYAFNYKGKWARFWIVFGGPLFNFVLAYGIFFILLIAGEKIPMAKFGMLSKDSFLSVQGVQSGDVLHRVNDVYIQGITDFGFGENDNIRSIGVKRKIKTANNKIVDKDFDIVINVSFKRFMEELFKYPPHFRRPIVVDVRGNKYGVSSIKGVVDWTKSLEDIVLDRPQSLYLYRFIDESAILNRAEGESGAKGSNEVRDSESENYWVDYKIETVINIANEAQSVFESLSSNGFYMHDLQVKKLLDGGAANKAGIRSGDILVSINNVKIYSFDDLRRELFEVSKKDIKSSVSIQYYRNTSLNTMTVYPDVQDEEGKKVFKLGIYSSAEFVPLSFVQSDPQNVFSALYLGLIRSWDAFTSTVMGVKKLIMREVSFKNVGGPIAIGKVASDSYNVGISYFFKIMAVISINLCVINLFPIPVLDGGHIFFICCELFNRGPLSRKKMEIAQRFGLSLLLLLVFAAIFNDLVRIFK